MVSEIFSKCKKAQDDSSLIIEDLESSSDKIEYEEISSGNLLCLRGCMPCATLIHCLIILSPPDFAPGSSQLLANTADICLDKSIPLMVSA